uniref:lysosomal amino acid transporter 1 homolog n=1 Tax=Ciona intestinalis TaxID=7719 RepID=UPI00006A706B|nr:lysosomal amino acid transporter 1 homolog [Ciona intestinalis]|eukprot:XP_002128014.1 lysosomal amino acid transporter 1 homolog [Ciona intestinalis]
MFPIIPIKSALQEQYVLSASINTSNSTNASCLRPDAVYWVYIAFHECIYNAKEEIGFILGLVSILCWICASLPQLYENYKRGKVDEALSFWFLLLWLLGDSSNLIGCVLTNQFPIQLYTAVYYVGMDLVMIFQFSYYYLKHKRSEANRRGIINDVMSSTNTRNQRVLCCLCLAVFIPFSYMSNSVQEPIVTQHRIGRTLLAVKKDPSFISWSVKTITGYTIGCVSSIFYLGSRLPQILKNIERGQTEGVSWLMFFLAVAGNSLYGSSILLQDPDPGHTWSEFLLFHLPWLIGSLGTLTLDFIVLSQIIYYNDLFCKRKRRPLGLLEDDETNDQDNNPLIVDA